MYDNVMNLRNKVYQMFMISPQSTDMKNEVNLKIALNNGLGGVIFFSKNILSIEQVKKFTSQIKDNALVSPFIGIDQEGGRVERTENIFNGKKFLSAKFQAEKGIDVVFSQTKEIAQLIKSMGFNMNFAPVLDVNTNPKNPIIGERAYGVSADDVEKYAICAMQTYLQNDIIPVGKHFPGHGNVNMDSHLTLPTLGLSFDDIEKIHVKPFKTAIEKGLPAIMVAHLYCPCFDNEKIPSSLSRKVLDYLRNKLKFKGLVVSDDMQMGALQMINPVDAVIKSINAGVNLFLYRDSTDETINIIEKVYEKTQSDDELKFNIEKSFDIIQKIKLSYNHIL